MDCIFCRIISGEIPSYKVYEDEDIIAILDISQVTKGHTLVIPKIHCRNLYELDPDHASRIFRQLPRLANAIKKAFDPIGLNIVINTEKPLQAVFHFHIHLIPRYENDEFVIASMAPKQDVSKALFIETCDKIKKEL
ncbi:MAG: HIT family protein [Candidatus Izemoplasmatales bacterium]|jgi:histidine triad (HIT) family protein|nr:HIT family protein [Candidatus Izemoplasmatales bacterium]